MLFIFLSSLSMTISRSNHVTENGIISFLMANIPLSICTTSLSILLLDIKAASMDWTLGYIYLSELWFSQNICPFTGFLSFRICLVLLVVSLWQLLWILHQLNCNILWLWFLENCHLLFLIPYFQTFHDGWWIFPVLVDLKVGNNFFG